MTPDACLALHFSLYWEVSVAILFYGVCLLVTGLIYRL